MHSSQNAESLPAVSVQSHLTGQPLRHLPLSCSPENIHVDDSLHAKFGERMNVACHRIASTWGLLASSPDGMVQNSRRQRMRTQN
jgi:hypothetical protein